MNFKRRKKHTVDSTDNKKIRYFVSDYRKDVKEGLNKTEDKEAVRVELV
jgi:hypothetical protein